ncbi:Zn(2+)-responsive transcriptional regulator [Aliikangiella sp. IMCC44359]|uniref:Zn(2+)-responsive transcriptional regulator n=1 Tax=Aliikangiella sp. IMCC44359 TaxID=3459125 RepID=UPI00403AA70A
MIKHFYKIGELANKAGTTVEALRFYESQGLISARKRSSSGYRLYNEQDAQKLYFILHAKKVGFSLKEINQLLGLQLHRDEHTCQEVKHYTGKKISEIEAKINDLEKMKYALNKMHKACCGGAESAINCTILQTLEDPDFFKIKPE